MLVFGWMAAPSLKAAYAVGFNDWRQWVGVRSIARGAEGRPQADFGLKKMSASNTGALAIVMSLPLTLARRLACFHNIEQAHWVKG